MDIRSNTFFFYGEIGKRLDGVRNSEISQQSAKTIRNMYVTELGNLKIAKQFLVKSTDITDIVEILDTRYNFYIVVSKDKIYSVEKDTNKILYTRQINTIDYKTNCKMFDDSLMICGENPQVFEFDNETGNIGSSNFLELLDFPILEKETVTLTLFRIYSIKVGSSTELRCMQLAKYDSPKLEVKNNSIYLESSNIKLDRIYKQSRSTIEASTIKDAKDGLTFGVMETFYNNVIQNGETIKQYILGNHKIEFTNATKDELYGAEYFTSISKNGIKGELNFGKLQVLKNNFLDCGVFGTRFYIIKDDIIFFSKTDNFFNFRNGIKDDDPFFFKPSPINNQRPKYLRSKAGNRLYITTNKGVYTISYTKLLTPNSYEVYIASEIPSLWECELIGNNFYYISEDEVVKCVQVVPNQLGYENYSVFTVEKYNLESKPKFLTKITIDGETKLVTQSNDEYIEIYDVIDTNVFRKITLDITHQYKLFGNNQMFIENNRLFLKSNINYKTAILELNAPYLSTKTGGNYCNDYNSIINKISVKFINGGKEAIKNIEIVGAKVNNLAKDQDDFSVYKVQCSARVGTGYKIIIQTNENENILELLGVDTFIKIASDN